MVVTKVNSFREILERFTRRGLEIVTRDIVFSRKLPPEFGSVRIFVSSSAGLKYLFRPMRKIDPSLLLIARELIDEGKTVWDIGANIGLFSFAAAGRAGQKGRVVAFEPDAWLIQLLRRSASKISAQCAEVTVVPVAVADDIRLDEFNISKRSRAKSALAGFGYMEPTEIPITQMVVTVNLDWAMKYLPAPDVIKIDVEGAEMKVLQGAVHLLETKRPTVICEVGEENQDAVTRFLQERGYALYDCEDNSVPRLQKNAAPWNTLAIPKARND